MFCDLLPEPVITGIFSNPPVILFNCISLLTPLDAPAVGFTISTLLSDGAVFTCRGGVPLKPESRSFRFPRVAVPDTVSFHGFPCGTGVTVIVWVVNKTGNVEHS